MIEDLDYFRYSGSLLKNQNYMNQEIKYEFKT